MCIERTVLCDGDHGRLVIRRGVNRHQLVGPRWVPAGRPASMGTENGAIRTGGSVHAREEREDVSI